MKFAHVITLAGLVAASFGLMACDDDSSSASGEDDVTAGLDCSVSGGVKVLKPAAGDSFKMGETITVVYGSDVQGSGYRFVYKTDEDDGGLDMLKESAGPKNPDGKTCYVQKVVLDEEYAEPSKEAVIRVIPYEKTSKGANSGAFKVSE